ncbi:hypothetical protein [Paraburkholderia humisilvae]|uniref:hypothetical protein n=1 Tax=Paraburkholderia humisilvae TaxID=627669 RepID=UPI0035EB1E58
MPNEYNFAFANSSLATSGAAAGAYDHGDASAFGTAPSTSGLSTDSRLATAPDGLSPDGPSSGRSAPQRRASGSGLPVLSEGDLSAGFDGSGGASPAQGAPALPAPLQGLVDKAHSDSRGEILAGKRPLYRDMVRITEIEKRRKVRTIASIAREYGVKPKTLYEYV